MNMLVHRRYLNGGGYDRTGQYWGVDKPLYDYQDEETGDIYGQVRAYDREDACRKVLALYPSATFRGFRVVAHIVGGPVV